MRSFQKRSEQFIIIGGSRSKWEKHTQSKRQNKATSLSVFQLCSSGCSQLILTICSKHYNRLHKTTRNHTGFVVKQQRRYWSKFFFLFFFTDWRSTVFDHKQVVTVIMYTVQILIDNKANDVQIWLKWCKNKLITLNIKICNCSKVYCGKKLHWPYLNNSITFSLSQSLW